MFSFHHQSVPLWILFLLQLFNSSQSVVKRPFFNIAHMVNSIKEIDPYLSRGANAIEADVVFSPNGTALSTYHGLPCDCFRHCTEREDIEEYLKYVQDITHPVTGRYSKQLTLLFLDLKVSQLQASVKANAGADLARKVVKNLYDDGQAESPIRMLISIGHTYDYDFVLGFQNELETRGLQWLGNERIGWDVGLNDNVDQILSMWRRLEVINNVWLGDGITNCLSPFYNLGRLAYAITKRDERNKMIRDPIVDKVYHWTIDFHHNLRFSLRNGVDGILTNHPERLVSILREAEFVSKYRMATLEDNPWFRIQSDIEDEPVPIPQNSNNYNQPVRARVVASAVDILASLNTYLREWFVLRFTA
ncbi:dermonecrotic toxin StSicTox-betaIB1i-like [Brevipalpus obovatus]|uniref:dermonecrotic toxin StSicTox-betaIB1i-like n=1 Tax=Brevipalpus obovatus TaxID=246614 RepID=UPI003D9EDB36